MTPTDSDLEVRFRWVSTAFVALVGACLALGLALHVAQSGGPDSVALLQGGLVLLMSAPAARLLVALVERIRRRDWTFVAMTLIVAVELALVMWRASRRL